MLLSILLPEDRGEPAARPCCALHVRHPGWERVTVPMPEEPVAEVAQQNCHTQGHTATLLPVPCSGMCQPVGTPARLDTVAVAGQWLASAVAGKRFLSVTTGRCLPGEVLLCLWLQEGAGQGEGLQLCHTVLPRFCCMCPAPAGPCSSCQSCHSAQELGNGAGCDIDCPGHPGLFWGLGAQSGLLASTPVSQSALSPG